MTAVHLASGPISSRTLGELIYEGEVVVFKGLAAMGALCAHADGMLRQAMAPHEPDTAQGALDRREYLARIEALQTDFGRDAETSRLATTAFVAAGLDPGHAFRDRLNFRVLPPGDSHTGRRTATLGPHRDSWASNVAQQINWWAPVRPIGSERTIALYPAYWARAVPNSSGDWDLHAMRTHRARARAGEYLDSYPVVPEPTGAIDTTGELRLVLEPGDLMCFSAAHLHATIPNRTRVARFSLDFRTVDLDDLITGRGAPNIDGAAPHLAHDWFRRLTDGLSLAEALEGAAKAG